MSTYIRIVRRHVLHNEMGKTSYLDLREEYIIAKPDSGATGNYFREHDAKAL